MEHPRCAICDSCIDTESGEGIAITSAMFAALLCGPACALAYLKELSKVIVPRMKKH